MDPMEKIYQEHSRTVYAFLLSRTHNADLAEELTQETFFQAVGRIETFQGDSSIVTWLCGIAKNLWRSYLKKKVKEPERLKEELPSGEEVEEDFFLKWDSLQVLKLLHGLKGPMREVVYLRLIGNLTFRQIGEIMGESENWARVNFYRGKEKIVKEAGKL